MVRKHEVTMYELELFCDKCGGVMKWSGMTLTFNPPQYPHYCASCGNHTTEQNTYPHTTYERKIA